MQKYNDVVYNLIFTIHCAEKEIIAFSKQNAEELNYSYF